MTKMFTYRTARNFSVMLICAMLAACASTQRSSSSGPGVQTPAPIDEPGRASQQESAPSSAATTARPSTRSTTERPSTEAPAVENSATRDPVKTGKPLATTEPQEERMEPAPAAAAAPSEDDADLKRRLAEQEAEIERLRNAQRAEAARVEQQAREQERAQPPVAAQDQSGATTTAPSQAAAPQAGAGTTSSAAPKRDEEAVVFPPAASSAQSSESQAAAPGAIPRSVYFHYDQSTIPEKYDAMLLEHAGFLKAHPDVKIEVQGNCDERGSREYNLALGARRSQAVKRALELGGASGKQIRTVSFGSEKPISTGKDEESYSKNRRVDVVY